MPQRRTKIVATIGPASTDPEVLLAMVNAGMDVARLNFSHGTHELHAETARLVREASERAGRAVAILQDLPGPKIRIGQIEEGEVLLRAGDVTLRLPDKATVVCPCCGQAMKFLHALRTRARPPPAAAFPCAAVLPA